MSKANIETQSRPAQARIVLGCMNIDLNDSVRPDATLYSCVQMMYVRNEVLKAGSLGGGR